MKVFIGYVSMSGNTEDMATIMKDALTPTGCEINIESLEDVSAEDLKDYDCIFIGAYTWGDGDLPYEAEDFFEELNTVHLNQVVGACFGSGDSVYPKYCAAVDTLAEKLIERGCDIFEDRLKIELNPETDEQIFECKQFAESVYRWALEKKGIPHV